MFYKMLERARNVWYASSACTVSDLIAYMEQKGELRDAQIDAIKTYLYLKVACQCQPLRRLFIQGKFNFMDLDALPLSTGSRSYLKENRAAAALLEYASLTDKDGQVISPKLKAQLEKDPESVDCKEVFSRIFYGVSYTDYLFSLPMGAGKTYLMAAFIYLDLYFALNEPQNPAFAHNFIVFAPSGLKSSVVPSLKTIQKFDPSWVIPEPAASSIKRMISFEVLDQGKTANKSNKIKNPNVQKIANHQPLSELFGLVAVTNAEKVIYDRLEQEDMQLSLFTKEEQAKISSSKELRRIIGKIPNLSIYIDEVHHASAGGDSKLRAVVNRWAENSTVNSVVGFSGTPYLEKTEKIAVTNSLNITSSEISNIVYYYPLISGVGNFLKRPVVKLSDIADSGRIIESGTRQFLDSYKDKVYPGGLVAKLGIYCGTIEKLEEFVYPLVSRIVAEYGLTPDCILKFHKGNKQYPQPTDSQMLFDTLDRPISKIRIVLLVQIGKEGWDCRSLTGIILSQEGDCPKNMVLQTACRCLRQVEKNAPETAIIYLNDSNAEKLNAQLQQQHRISLKEFSQADNCSVTLKRYDRTAYLKLPKIDFYQLRVNYETMVLEPANPEKQLPNAAQDAKLRQGMTITTDFSMEQREIAVDDEELGNVPATFSSWLMQIVKGSFGTLTMAQLKVHSELLEPVYETITYEKDGTRFYSSKYDRSKVEANIRKAFCDRRSFTTVEERIPQTSGLLRIENFTTTVTTSETDSYYPPQEQVERIILDDAGKLKADPKTKQMMELAEATGQTAVLELLRKQTASHPHKDRSFHYLPYRTDSSFEQKFLEEVLSLSEVARMDLEVYYNGDRAMTEFKIKCYKGQAGAWRYVGMYTPDFLIVRRKDGQIYQAIIVETKGAIYANDPAFKEKRSFMEQEFTRQNNEAFGYERFEYLYLEDSMSMADRIDKTREKICAFFEEYEKWMDLDRR